MYNRDKIVDQWGKEGRFKQLIELDIQLKKEKWIWTYLSYLIHKNQIQMDLNMKSILIGLEENKSDYSDTEVEISFSKEDAKLLTKKTRMINLTPLK